MMGTYSDLDKEVPQMFLKSRDVLVEAEQTLDKHLDLSTADNKTSMCTFSRQDKTAAIQCFLQENLKQFTKLHYRKTKTIFSFMSCKATT